MGGISYVKCVCVWNVFIICKWLQMDRGPVLGHSLSVIISGRYFQIILPKIKIYGYIILFKAIVISFISLQMDINEWKWMFLFSDHLSLLLLPSGRHSLAVASTADIRNTTKHLYMYLFQLRFWYTLWSRSMGGICGTWIVQSTLLANTHTDMNTNIGNIVPILLFRSE